MKLQIVVVNLQLFEIIVILNKLFLPEQTFSQLKRMCMYFLIQHAKLLLHDKRSGTALHNGL